MKKFLLITLSLLFVACSTDNRSREFVDNLHNLGYLTAKLEDTRSVMCADVYVVLDTATHKQYHVTFDVCDNTQSPLKEIILK